MKNPLFLLLFVGSFFYFSGCKKAGFSHLPEGIYEGKYNVSIIGNGTISSRETSLLLLNGTFINPKGPGYFPGGGSGNYKVLGKQSIWFGDRNPWTDNFDGGLVIDGLYEYTFNGKTLIIWKESFKRYELNLELVKKL